MDRTRFARRILVNHSFSKRSSVSNDDPDANGDDDDDNDDSKASSNEAAKKKKSRFHTPFIFKVLKLNAPEWPWILLGAVSSIIYGAVQPLFALFFAKIYGLFAEPNLDEQERLTSLYAAMIFVIGFGGGLTQFLSALGFAKSGEALTLRMRKMSFAAMLRQEMGYFDHESNSIGALVTRLSSDASALKVWKNASHVRTC